MPAIFLMARLMARSDEPFTPSTKAMFGLGLAVGIIIEVFICLFIAFRYRHERENSGNDIEEDVEYGTTANKAELHHDELPRTQLPRTHGRCELPETPLADNEKAGGRPEENMERTA